MSDAGPESNKPENMPARPVTSVARKGATGSGRRPAPGNAGGAGSFKAPPPRPDRAKMIAIVVCGLLLAACVGVGIYKVFFKAGPPPKVTKLDSHAQDLADRADIAKKLYEEAREKAKGTTLADFNEAESKMDKAREIFNSVADAYESVPGHEEDIKFARDKKDSIDAELLTIRKKRAELEMADVRTHTKPSTTAAAPNTPATETTPVPPLPAPAGKEPTAEQLSDKNLDRLFNDDPDEYERLAKIREKKDPTFKAKKP